MATFNSRNTPVLLADGGFQAMTLAVVDAPVLLGDAVNVPVSANSAWIQPASGSTLYFRLDGDVGNLTDWMELPPLAVLPLTNKHQLQNLVLASISGTANVNVQFFAGSIGPMPPAPEIQTASSGPVPPGGGSVTSVDVNGGSTGFSFSGGPITVAGILFMSGRARMDTENTIWVMKNGVNATGLRNRFDRPFLTIAAAEFVALPGDSIVILPGDYIENSLGVNRVTYIRMGANLAATGSNTLFSINAITCKVRGWGRLESDLGTVVVVTNGGSVVIDGDINSPDGTGVYVIDGDCVIDGSVSALNDAVGTVNGSVDIHGDVTSQTAIGLSVVNGGSARVRGTVEGATFSVSVIDGSADVVDVLNRTNGVGVYLEAPAASLRVRRNVVHDGVGFAVNNQNGSLTVDGSVTHAGSGIGVKTNNNCVVHGDVRTVDNLAVFVVGGIAEFKGNCHSDQEYPVAVTDGSCILFGLLSSNNAAKTIITIDESTANVQLMGSCYLRPAGIVKAIQSFVGNTVTVRSYGAYSRTVENFPLVVVVGTLNVLP